MSLLPPLPKSAQAATDSLDLLNLLQATESRAAALQAPGSYNYPTPDTLSEGERPLWPIYSFLWAEIYRLRGDVPQARRIYQSLATWSAGNPYNEGWGGSGLAVVALWR